MSAALSTATFLTLCTSLTHPVFAASANPINTYTFPRYIVTTQKTFPNDVSGTQLIIYEHVNAHRRIRSYWHWMDGQYIDSVSAWHIPGDRSGRMRAIKLACSWPAGSAEEFIILAQVGVHRWKRVFDGHSDDGFHHDVETADVDGDSQKEIILTPRYRAMDENGDTSNTKSEIWKWSSAAQKYILLRKVPFARRFQRPANAG